MGAFAANQAAYAERGIATFPVVIDREGGKHPAVRGWQKVGTRISAELAERFVDADAFGFCPGRRSGVTILDVDSADEKELIDAFDRHGPSPFVVKSGGGGFHAWYRFSGEGRKIRPWEEKPVDVLGGGCVVAPPSLGVASRYELLQGSLDDLARLPVLVHSPRAPGASEGKRNGTLFAFCMKTAKRCNSLDELMELAVAEAATYNPPMLGKDADEIVRTARSAWGYEERGENWFGCGSVVVTDHAEIDRLAASDPDAFALLAILRRHHWGRDQFPIAKAMAASLGWRLSRFRSARGRLVNAGMLRCLTAGGRGKNDPPVFSFPS